MISLPRSWFHFFFLYIHHRFSEWGCQQREGKEWGWLSADEPQSVDPNLQYLPSGFVLADLDFCPSHSLQPWVICTDYSLRVEWRLLQLPYLLLLPLLHKAVGLLEPVPGCRNAVDPRAPRHFLNLRFMGIIPPRPLFLTGTRQGALSITPCDTAVEAHWVV